MKKSRTLRFILVTALVLQMVIGLQIPVYAVSAPQLTANAVSTTEISLNWNSISDATGYEIWRSANEETNFAFLNSQSGTTYSDTSVAENNKYRYKVIAVSGAVYSGPSNIVTVYTDLTPPSQPENLQLTSTVNSVTLNWDASNDGAGMGVEKYNVYGRSESQQFSLVGSPTTNTFTHTNLAPNTSYYYYVKAVDRAQLESEASSVMNILTLPDTDPPQAPTGLAATVVSDSRIDLTWNQPSDNVGVVSYVVYRSNASNFSASTTYSTSSRSYSFTGLSTGTTYYFKVRALDSSSNISSDSSVVSATTQTDTQKPTPPTIWAQATSSTQVRLTWYGATDNKGVVGYEVYRALGSGSFSLIASDDASPYTDNGVSSNNTYKYYIKAKDAAGNFSDASNTVTVTTNGDTQAPSKPQNLRLSLVSNTEVKLTWDASTDNRGISGYKIYRALESDSFEWISSTGSSTTTYNNSGLTANKTYKYYVKAYDAAGNESESSDVQTIYTSTSARTDEKTITASQGGTLEITDMVKLVVPSDALARNADYKMVTKSFGSYTNTGYKTFGQPVEITVKAGSASITSFDKELTLTFYYTSSELGSTNTNKLGIYYWDTSNNVWVRIPSTVSASSQKVTANINHLTVFALLADIADPPVPTLNNPNSSTKRIVSLTGKAENNVKVYIDFNGSTFSVNADSRGNFAKEVILLKGRNEIRLKAEDAAGNQSSWSSVYIINCTPFYELFDISGHWAEYNVQKVLELGITSGYEDKTFRPNRTITRAEFCNFIVSALGYSPVTNPQLSFKDAGSIPTWAKGFVARAVEKGIVSGYNDGTFKADRQITRQEMASMLIRAMNLQSEANSRQYQQLNFRDSGQIQSWARGAVVMAVEKGLIKGYSDNTFGPVRNATRAEAITMIVKMLDNIQ